MASQPSEYSEERNLLRLRAWEQRNQGTSHAKEQESVPLFGEPYKTNKGDELSHLIQRMLGSYEDVNHPNPAATEPVRIPTYAFFSQPDQGQTNLDSSAGPPFRVQAVCSQSQKGPSSKEGPSQSSRTSGAASSPDPHGNSSTFPRAPLNHSQLSYAVPCHQRSQERLRDLAQEVRSRSPHTKPVSLQRSGDLGNTGADTKDQRPRMGPSECPGYGDLSALGPRDSTKDSSLPPANKGHPLPSQTFPSLLSKQPSVVMTQKPTAYVRPMDGQDQVANESPELKPSPEPYVPLPEPITKPHMETDKEMPPPYLEMRPDEARCVEDILREMTCSWPPILTAINTPNSDRPSKSPPQPQGAEYVSSHPGQTEELGPSAADSSQRNIHQSSSCSLKARRSSGLESTSSSSDSESSSRSDSDSESAAEEPPKCPGSSSMKAECTGPAAKHVDWQLGNWIRPSQQNCHAEGHCETGASESPGPPPSRCPAEAVEPGWEAKPQRDFTGKAGKALACGERREYNHKQPVSPAPPSPASGLTSCGHKHSGTPNSASTVRAGSVHTAAGVVGGKVGERDHRLAVRPKVKSKMGPSRKGKDEENTRTSKHEWHQKCEAGPESEVALVLYGHCPSCGVQYPSSCPCPTRSPAQPDPLSPAPPIRINCAKSKSDAVCQKGTKVPPKITPKHPDKTQRGLRDSHRCAPSLLVRIHLSLLCRVPQVSSNPPESLRAKKSASVAQLHAGRSGEASAAQKPGQSSKKSRHLPVDHKGSPKKKPRLEKRASSGHACVKLKTSRGSTEDPEGRRRAGKPPEQQQQQQLTVKKASRDKRASPGFLETPKNSCKRKMDSGKQRKSVGKQTEAPPRSHKELAKSSAPLPPPSSPARRASTQRPLLRGEDRQFPVKHYIKEAKKLKHKADAEPDKLCKAFSYVDAAMYFVESGLAMERDHQISTSSYTMFAETVELLKFVLKLKSPVDASAPPLERDFVALCLKCQSLLHMAMYRHKQKTAIRYSKTLTDHFSNSAQRTQSPLVLTPKATGTPSPMPGLPSPAPSTSGPCSGHGGDPVSSSVTVPQAIEQVAFSYVNITSLFLRAHEIWEKAEELARTGSGLLTELDAVMGPLNLMSSMTFMVRYTRQGVDWLRQDCRRAS